MGTEIALRFVIFLEIASGLIVISLYFDKKLEFWGWGPLMSGAVVISFLYFVFHVPLRKRLRRLESE